jgi:hypothetical protein
MYKRIPITIALALSLAACASLYTTSRNWKMPAGLGDYDLTATMSVGLLIRQITISVNGRELLAGQSWFWSDSIDMEGTIDRFPIAALCHIDVKQCDVTIAGIRGITLNF